jgi:hypothetical protein
MRTALLGLVAVVAVAAVLVSGDSGTDSVRHRYLPADNRLLTIDRYGDAREVSERSLGSLSAIRRDPRWLARARALGPGAPPWARRMYARSLLVLHALTHRNGAVLAGAREGWAYVWPRDAGTAAIAFAAAGYRGEARRVVRFLLGLDLGAAARFHPDGSPVSGRAAQGDAAGWVAAAARAAGLHARPPPQPWRDRADYQEGTTGNYLANAIATTAAGGTESRDMDRFEARRRVFSGFAGEGGLVRRADDPGSGLDSAAAWAVRPFSLPALYPLVRRTLLRLTAESGRFGILPSQDWDGGDDPWTAPTAWTAWSLAALARRDRRRGAKAIAHRERATALHLMAALRRDATPVDLLPERIDASTGVPTSTTPLAWSHAFAILALCQLWPWTASTSTSRR